MEEPKKSYFNEHEELAFVLKCFAVIAAIILLGNFVKSYAVFLIIPLPFILLFLIRFLLDKSIRDGKSFFSAITDNMTLIPVAYTEGESRYRDIPLFTYLLILANAVIYYVIQLNPSLNTEFIMNNFTFLAEEPNLWNTPVGLFTSMFMHGSGGHLWGNMMFLWAMGTVVEKRIGSSRFLFMYILTGLFASLASMLIYLVFMGEATQSLGASGAIAGVMGVYAIRCYFKSMVFPIPILGIFFFILPLSIKIRINALVIIGLFFVLDLHGGIGQISGSVYSMIGHWAHVCGMLSGILIAVIFKLSNDAVEERHTEIGVKGSGGFTNLGGMAESLNKALDQNPENTEALVHLARIKSKFHVTDEGRELYKKAIAILIRTEPKEATETFKEFYSKYMEGVTPALMHRISGVLYKSGDLDLSARTLEMILDDPSAPIEVRERSMYQLVIILELMCLSEAALRHIDNFIEEFPSSTMIEKATEKKRELTESLLSEKL